MEETEEQRRGCGVQVFFIKLFVRSAGVSCMSVKEKLIIYLLFIPWSHLYSHLITWPSPRRSSRENTHLHTNESRQLDAVIRKS